MSRYIDADALIEEIEGCSYETWSKDVNRTWWAQAVKVKDNIKACIERQSTADVVEVVRCKDCKHLEIINSKDLYAKCRMTDLEFKPFDIDTRKHYCSYGERKENENY